MQLPSPTGWQSCGSVATMSGNIQAFGDSWEESCCPMEEALRVPRRLYLLSAGSTLPPPLTPTPAAHLSPKTSSSVAGVVLWCQRLWGRSSNFRNWKQAGQVSSSFRLCPGELERDRPMRDRVPQALVSVSPCRSSLVGVTIAVVKIISTLPFYSVAQRPYLGRLFGLLIWKLRLDNVYWAEPEENVPREKCDWVPARSLRSPTRGSSSNCLGFCTVSSYHHLTHHIICHMSFVFWTHPDIVAVRLGRLSWLKKKIIARRFSSILFQSTNDCFQGVIHFCRGPAVKGVNSVVDSRGPGLNAKDCSVD